MAHQLTQVCSESEAGSLEPGRGTFLSPRWHSPVRLAIKRALDVTVSAIFLLLLAPVFVVLAIAVKFSSSGPIFYRWKVVGRGGQPGHPLVPRRVVPDRRGEDEAPGDIAHGRPFLAAWTDGGR